MLMNISFISIIVSTLIFIYFNNPLILIMFLILSTLAISLMMFYWSLTSWFSYILILIYLGGMMVLFSYTANVASNEMSILPLNIIMIALTISIMFIMMNNLSSMKFEFMFDTNNKEMSINHQFDMKSFQMSHMFNEKNSKIISLLISFMLILLIVIAKLIKMNEGPVRFK